MIDFAADAAAIAADTQGLSAEATYTPSGGSAAAIRVIPSLPDEQTRFGGAIVASPTATFLVPVSSVASWSDGDTITFGGTTFHVQGVPERDPRQIWWTVEASPE